MDQSQRNLRKAAILLASLDTQEAEALLRQMSPAQSQSLRQARQHLGKFDPAEQGSVIEEFFRVGPLLPDLDSSGIDLDAPTTLKLNFPPDTAIGDSTPFRSLREAPPHKLVPFLEREHPQTVAVVVSHLPADRAAEVLAQLPGGLQIEVARRLVDLEEADPEVLREVERGLEAWLSAQAGERRESGGVAALASILSAADPQSRHQILSNLARHDRQLAEKLEVPAAPLLSFSDLECMDSASLAVILQHAETELLVLALAGAKPEFFQRATELLGARGPHIRHALHNLGPTRLSDVEEAQRQLADLARQLEQRGEVTPEVRGRLSLAI